MKSDFKVLERPSPTSPVLEYLMASLSAEDCGTDLYCLNSSLYHSDGMVSFSLVTVAIRSRRSICRRSIFGPQCMSTGFINVLHKSAFLNLWSLAAALTITANFCTCSILAGVRWFWEK